MNKFIIALNNLNLKKAALAVFVLSLGLSVPLITLLLKNETTIFSSASVGDNQQVIDESTIPYPSEPPQINHVTKFYGRPGDSILIYGKNFGDAQKESFVKIGDTPITKENILYWSNEEIEVSLPDKEGLHKLMVEINGNSSTWIGRINIYTPLTANVLFINDAENFIRSPNGNFSLKVYSISGEVRVFGVKDVQQQKLSVPIELADSNILYIELYVNDQLSAFRVEEP